MANTITLSAQDTLINTIITKLRSGEYDASLVKVDPVTFGYEGFQLKNNVTLVTTKKESVVSKVLVVGEQEFTGKYVRRLHKAVVNKLNPANNPSVSRKKETVAQETIDSLMDLI